MAKKDLVDAQRLSGFKYFRLLDDLFESLHDHATERDKAGKRKLYCDQYARLMLLYFFNPTVETLRGVQQFTTLEKVQRLLGVSKSSLGSLSEASRVFDPKIMEPIIAELARQALQTPQAMPPADQAALAGLVAVDGSLLKAVPRMAWALWQDAEHRAVKMHVAFAVWPGVPIDAAVTEGTGSEREQWRRMAKKGGFYVVDRGYADYTLFRELDALGCRFISRVQANAVWETERENELTAEDRAAGVIQDVVLKRLGTEKHNALLKKPLRVVQVQGETSDDRWILVTNDLNLSAELISTAYRHRWQVELFFRWIKCVLGCRRLLSESPEGVTMQVYLAIVACLLIGLWIGVKPNKRTYEMLCHYFNGWATAQEVENQILKLKKSTGPPSNN